jgi:hypothetical protein
MQTRLPGFSPSERKPIQFYSILFLNRMDEQTYARFTHTGLILPSYFPVDAGRLINHSSFLEWIGGALLLCDFCTDVTENTDKIGYIGFI